MMISTAFSLGAFPLDGYEDDMVSGKSFSWAGVTTRRNHSEGSGIFLFLSLYSFGAHTYHDDERHEMASQRGRASRLKASDEKEGRRVLFF
jgi:hypothetical protein